MGSQNEAGASIGTSSMQIEDEDEEDFDGLQQEESASKASDLYLDTVSKSLISFVPTAEATHKDQ